LFASDVIELTTTAVLPVSFPTATMQAFSSEAGASRIVVFAGVIGVVLAAGGVDSHAVRAIPVIVAIAISFFILQFSFSCSHRRFDKRPSPSKANPICPSGRGQRKVEYYELLIYKVDELVFSRT
jgi:hypothetical protein